MLNILTTLLSFIFDIDIKNTTQDSKKRNAFIDLNKITFASLPILKLNTNEII